MSTNYKLNSTHCIPKKKNWNLREKLKKLPLKLQIFSFLTIWRDATLSLNPQLFPRSFLTPLHLISLLISNASFHLPTILYTQAIRTQLRWYPGSSLIIFFATRSPRWGSSKWRKHPEALPRAMNRLWRPPNCLSAPQPLQAGRPCWRDQPCSCNAWFPVVSCDLLSLIGNSSSPHRPCPCGYKRREQAYIVRPEPFSDHLIKHLDSLLRSAILSQTINHGVPIIKFLVDIVENLRFA